MGAFMRKVAQNTRILKIKRKIQSTRYKDTKSQISQDLQITMIVMY